MIEGLSLGNDMLVVDVTARLYREGTATRSREVGEILDRLGRNAGQWQARLTRLSRGDRLG
jgi:hypothetical protein